MALTLIQRKTKVKASYGLHLLSPKMIRERIEKEKKNNL